MQHRCEAETPGRSAPPRRGPAAPSSTEQERDDEGVTLPCSRPPRRCSGCASPPTAWPICIGETVSKALTAATVDDIAFAVQRLGDEADANYRGVTALKLLHDRARRAGALGADIAVDAAVRFEERRK
jgi:hypothetical protein